MSFKCCVSKKIFLKLAVAVFVLLVAIQLVPYGRDHSNPKVAIEPAWDSPTTRELFFRSCKDCHSNETTWPWYSKVAPISWLVQYDVNKGRAEFNVSEWNRPKNEGDEAAEELREGEMPLWFYLPTHPEARLSDTERQTLIDGLIATFGEKESHESHTEHDDD